MEKKIANLLAKCDQMCERIATLHTQTDRNKRQLKMSKNNSWSKISCENALAWWKMICKVIKKLNYSLANCVS